MKMTGSKITIIICTAALAVVGLATFLNTGSEESLRWSIRRTADLAFILFFFSFAAASIHFFAGTQFSTWLLRNRRHIGISFAAIFLLHALLIYLLACFYPEPFLSELTDGVLWGGLITFSTAAIMGISSNNFSVKLLGRKAWRWLHTILGYYLCVTWIATYSIKLEFVFFWPFFAAAVALLLLRIAKIIAIKA